MKFQKRYLKRESNVLSITSMPITVCRWFYPDFYGYKTDPISLYRALRTINSSPFLIFYHFGDSIVVGSSPEILLRKVKERLIVCLPQQKLESETPMHRKIFWYAQELLFKEHAKHTMLIDLRRNDLGRVSEPGIVQITRKMAIERYFACHAYFFRGRK